MMMMNKKYNSFEEINRQLQILELQRKIDWEHIKLNSQAIRQNFSLPNLGRKTEIVLQQAAIGFVLKKMLKIRAKKKQREIPSSV